MIRTIAVALALTIPDIASAYTVTVGGPPIGDAPSQFQQRAFPASRFVEKPLTSAAAQDAQSSSFALKDMDSKTRQRTETALSQLGARQDGHRIIVNLPSDVLFDFDKYDIRADARPVLARLSEVLLAMPNAPVAIIGHTDSRGGDAYNQTLSERRAGSVGDWLAVRGVNRQRLTTEGRGEATPVAPNESADGSDDPAGRQKNRRVEFVIGSGD